MHSITPKENRTESNATAHQFPGAKSNVALAFNAPMQSSLASSFPAVPGVPAQLMAEENIHTRRFYKVLTKTGERILYLKKKGDVPQLYFIFQAGKRDDEEVTEILDPEEILEEAASDKVRPERITERTEFYSGPLGEFRQHIPGDLRSARKSAETGKTRFGPVDESPAVPYFGPYSVPDDDSAEAVFWIRDEMEIESIAEQEGLDLSQLTINEKLALLPKFITKGLDKDHLDPKIWVELKKAFDEQEKAHLARLERVEAEEFERKWEIDDEIVEEPQRRSASSRLSKVVLKGDALGKKFVEDYVPMPIDGTDPAITAVTATNVPTRSSREQSSSGKKKPAYVLNIPAHVSKNVPGVLKNYGDQATRSMTDGNKRIAAVVALNDRQPLVANNSLQQKVESITTDLGFNYSIVGFYWAPQYIKAGMQVLNFSDVKLDYENLNDPQAQAYVRGNLFKNPVYTDQKHLPYGLFREQAAASAYTKNFVTGFAQTNSPVYVHIGDPDAINWSVNNDNDEGVLARYDQIIEDMSKDPLGLKTPLPPMITGGYNLGEVRDDDSPEQKLVRLGNTIERSVRRSIAPVVPESMYATEPNMLVKAFDAREITENNDGFNGLNALQKPGAFGKKDAEGQALKASIAKSLGRNVNDPDFAPYVDATIETDIPDRINYSAKGHQKQILNLTEQKQSYLDPGNWTALPRTGVSKEKSLLKSHMEKLILGKLDEVEQDQ